jgi:hypothetical protein
MRLTVLQQQTKALREEQPQTGAEVFKRLESVKDLCRGKYANSAESVSDLTQYRLDRV